MPTDAHRLPNARNALIVLTLLATAMTVPTFGGSAQAAPVASVSGVLLTNEGVPITDARVRADNAWDMYPTNETGAFTVPVTPGQAPALRIVSYLAPNIDRPERSTWVLTTNKLPAVTGPVDLGELRLPPTQQHTVQIVDVDGLGLFNAQAGIGSSISDNMPAWQDAGANLSPDVTVAEASVFFKERTNNQGFAVFPGPRMDDIRYTYQKAAFTDESIMGSPTTYEAPFADGNYEGSVLKIPIKGFRASTPTAPGAPHLAMTGPTTAEVRISRGGFNNGRPITSYVVTLYPGAKQISVPATTTRVPVKGLQTGSTYEVTVRQRNDLGLSDESPRSFKVIARWVPSSPAIRRATAGAIGGRITAAVAWRAPAVTNGAAISGYRVRAYRVTASGKLSLLKQSALLRASSRSWTLRLASRASVKFRVVAYNAAGESKPSAASVKVAAR